MKHSFLKVIRLFTFGLVLTLAFTQFSNAQTREQPAEVKAESETASLTGQDISERVTAEMKMKQNNLIYGSGSKGLEGSWTVQVTIRNCQTGGAIRTIPRMITFARAGTLHEFAVAGTTTMPVNRGPGHGTWTFSFERNFSYSLQFFRLNADTSYGGYVRETRAVEMNETGDEFIATGTGAVYNADGTLAFPTCATESGVRFE